MSARILMGALVVAGLGAFAAACASHEEPAPAAVVAIPEEPAATPEFHGARIQQRDGLRSRVPTEN